MTREHQPVVGQMYRFDHKNWLKARNSTAQDSWTLEDVIRHNPGIDEVFKCVTYDGHGGAEFLHPDGKITGWRLDYLLPEVFEVQEIL